MLFGPERIGLTNDEVALADAILHVPLNPSFTSLNLAQAVLLITWEWYRTGEHEPLEPLPSHEKERRRPATHGKLVTFFHITRAESSPNNEAT